MEQSTTISFSINAPLDPMARGEHFEDPLYDWLEQNGGGPLDGGGGTMLHDDGRVVCDFFVELANPNLAQRAIQFVASLGVPVGSTYQIDGGDEVEFGDCHCVAFSMQKPPRFGQTRLGRLFSAVQEAIEGTGRLLTASENDDRLNFRVYGHDVDAITTAIATLVQQYSKYQPKIETIPIP